MAGLRRSFAVSVFASAVLAAFPAAGQSMKPAPVPPPPQLAAVPAAQRLAELAENYYRAQTHFDPVGTTVNGDNSVDGEMTMLIQPAVRASHFAMLQGVQEELSRIDRSKLSAADQLSYDCLAYEIRTALAFEPFPDHLLPLTQMDGMPSVLANFGSGQDSQPLQTPAQFEAYRKRMQALPEWIAVAIADMRSGMKQGIVQHKAIVQTMLAQVQALAGTTVEASPYYASIPNMPASFSAFEKAKLTVEYKDAVGKLLPELKKLAHFLETEYLPAARTAAGYGSFPNGQAWYRAWVAAQTTSTLSPDEIHEIGLREMARIEGELVKVGAKLGYSGPPAGIFQWLATQPQFKPFKTEQDVLEAYRKLYAHIQTKLPQLFSTLPKAALSIRAEPELTRDAASDHYSAGAADGSRPGTFWAVITDPTQYASTRMTSLFLHEGVPGHHFQISRTLELSLPKFRKFGANNAFVEGWALYGESLGKEMGLYDNDPNAYVGWLMLDMIRAARLVVDTGLHAKGWSREQTIRFLVEKAGNSEEAARNATERYMVWPGQALGYKIGALKILELRQLAERELGPKFQLAAFHDAVLENGALPLALLDQQIKAWIARQK